MALVSRQRLQAFRWSLVACAFLGLLVLAQASIASAIEPPSLGIRAVHRGATLIVDWVQPAGYAWDAGVRPGDIVIAVDAAVDAQHPGVPLTPDAVAKASRVRVRSPAHRAGGPEWVTVSVGTAGASAYLDALHRRATFFALAACFMLVGATIYVLSVDLATGHVVFGLALAGASALVAAVATPFRTGWALTVEHIAVMVFCTSVFLLFLVFPINRLSATWGRVAAGTCVGLTLLLFGLYAWVLAINSAAFAWLEPCAFALMATDFVGAVGLAIYALVERSARQGEVRPALALIVLGILAGLAPFYLLTIVPRLFGHRSMLLSPESAIVSIVLLPIALGAAVLSHQFPGITHLARRGLVALAVWTLLVTTYTFGLYLLYRAIDDGIWPLQPTLPLTALIVAFVGATFTPSQSWLRRTIERMLFHDVYNYAEALERLSTEIARLSDIEAIASHLLGSLAQTLDLSWAALRVCRSDASQLDYSWGACPTLATLWPAPGHGCQPVVATGTAAGTAAGAGCDAELPVNPQCAALVVPLVAEEGDVGTLAVGPKRGDLEHLPEDKALITTLAPLVTTALRNALLTQSLKQQVATLAERECALASLTERLLQAHEDERRRIALDLHDDPLQRAILLTREMSEVAGSGLPLHVHRSVEEIAVSLRAICTGLRPPMLDDLGLVAALEWLISDISVRSDLSASLNVDGLEPAGPQRVAADLAIALYRITQEALANCAKHARASHVSVTLQQDAQILRLRVVDDGQGLDSGALDGERPLHLGLLGMRERLRPWGGAVSVSGDPGGGTVVTAEVRVGGDDE